MLARGCRWRDYSHFASKTRNVSCCGLCLAFENYANSDSHRTAKNKAKKHGDAAIEPENEPVNWSSFARCLDCKQGFYSVGLELGRFASDVKSSRKLDRAENFSLHEHHRCINRRSFARSSVQNIKCFILSISRWKANLKNRKRVWSK